MNGKLELGDAPQTLLARSRVGTSMPKNQWDFNYLDGLFV
jgi:hypothetical protein